jgi:heme-degrading monooxygenase HmoA
MVQMSAIPAARRHCRLALRRGPYNLEPVSPRQRTPTMYIAMNRFKVALGSESDFETLWTSRDSRLKDVPGFVEFHLLKGPQREDHVLYASHTIWSDHAAFEAWTKSEAFRAAHQNAGGNRPLYLGHPEFEGFEVVQTVK